MATAEGVGTLEAGSRAEVRGLRGGMDDDEQDDGERSAQVRAALLKAVGVVVVIGIVIALGTTLVVRALGLDEGQSAGPVGADPATPRAPLPTTALPVPGQDSAEDAPTAEPSATQDTSKRQDVQLDISPVKARPMERVNLTGTYQGADNVTLEVQRYTDAQWRDFGVQATVRVGTYATYIQTARTGEQRLRMYDPQAKKGSNVVLVTIG